MKGQEYWTLHSDATNASDNKDDSGLASDDSDDSELTRDASDDSELTRDASDDSDDSELTRDASDDTYPRRPAPWLPASELQDWHLYHFTAKKLS